MPCEHGWRNEIDCDVCRPRSGTVHDDAMRQRLAANRVHQGSVAIHDATDKLPRVVDTDRVLSVYVHDDAMMTVPKCDWLWGLNWLDEQERPGEVSDRQMAMSVGESYRYLIMNCTKDEAWHRIQQMRRAVLAYEKPQD